MWCLNVSGLKKDLLQRVHTNPTPKCTLHMWVQMVAQEVDRPSLQPSIWHLCTLLMPPNWILRGCMSAGITPSKTEGAVEEVDSSACSAGTEASGFLDSWGGRWEMVERGAWQDFLGGYEVVGREECKTAPLRSPYKSSTSEPVMSASIFSNPSVSRCWASISSLHASSCSKLACFNRFSPYRKKYKKENKGIALQKSLETTRKEGRINLPLSTAPVPPLQVKLESPPPAPSSVECKYPSLPWFCSLGASSSAEWSVRKEKSRDEKDRLKKKKQRF